MTQFEKIKTMNIDDMAWKLCPNSCAYCSYDNFCEVFENCSDECIETIKEYLMSEVE